METITHIETGGVSRQIADAAARNALGIPTAPKTLKAGETEVTFTADNLKENSTIRVEVADIPSVSHNGITADGNSITVKFEPQENDILVRIVVFNELDGTVNWL